MYTILLAADADENQATKAANAVRSLPLDRDGLRVVVLNVFQEFDTPDEGAHVSSDEFYDEDEYPDSVGTAVSILEEGGITVEKRRTHGDAEDEILAVAEAVGADCIAMSGRRRSPTGKALFGSVTQHVMLHSDLPVITAMVD